ncbi:MAG: hypothetical protein OXT65_06365 [Alphaproteobacteria bacterium]|nr:hypothetical protein [Alphaproteobacteria bacterium]
MSVTEKKLSPAELHTLEVIADRGCTESVKRGHLEKLSRLELIEPCPEGVCMTGKGQSILVEKT